MDYRRNEICTITFICSKQFPRAYKTPSSLAFHNSSDAEKKQNKCKVQSLTVFNEQKEYKLYEHSTCTGKV
jgi:hypothetical protein